MTRGGRIKVIHSNTLVFIKILCDQTVEIGFHNDIQAQTELRFIKDADDQTGLTPDIGEHVMALWNNPGIQNAWEK